MIENSHSPSQRRLPGWLITVLRLVLTGLFPVFLVLTSVRLVMTETFLKIEYHRPGFPQDRYGFTREDRLHYAPYAIEYLRSDAGIEILRDLQQYGQPLYQPDELRHMEDVKVVTRAAFTVHYWISLTLLGIIVVLAWRRETRETLRWGLFGGGVFTILLIVTLIVLVLTNWDFFFTGFHSIFFEGNSWKFSTSDTLIRLFPEQFWFDAAITIGGLTIFGALGAMLAAWVWERRAEARAISPL